MAKADIARSGAEFTRLSDLFTDPALRQFSRRGERDGGLELYVPEPDLDFDGGEALELEAVQ